MVLVVAEDPGPSFSNWSVSSWPVFVSCRLQSSLSLMAFLSIGLGVGGADRSLVVREQRVVSAHSSGDDNALTALNVTVNRDRRRDGRHRTPGAAGVSVEARRRSAFALIAAIERTSLEVRKVPEPDLPRSRVLTLRTVGLGKGITRIAC